MFSGAGRLASAHSQGNGRHSDLAIRDRERRRKDPGLLVVAERTEGHITGMDLYSCIRSGIAGPFIQAAGSKGGRGEELIGAVALREI